MPMPPSRPTLTTLERRGDPAPAVERAELLARMRQALALRGVPAAVADALLDPASYGRGGMLRRYTLSRRLGVPPSALDAALATMRAAGE